MIRLLWRLAAVALFMGPLTAQSQDVRNLDVHTLRPEGSPILIDAYDARYQTFEDGYVTVAFLNERVTLTNVSATPVRAVELRITYWGAFGEQIDTVRETLIQPIAPQENTKNTFRSPLAGALPIYSAVIYPERVRVEAAGQTRIWQADSSDVAQRLERLKAVLSLTQAQR